MSTAILISGQLRTFAKCWPTQRWHVLRHFDDPHFFITVQDGPEGSALEVLRAEYGSDRVHTCFNQDPDLSAQLTPELARAYHNAPYNNAAPAHQLLLQHWYQSEVWHNNFLTHDDHEKFDTIIRMRADLWFHSFECASYVDGQTGRERFAHDRQALVPWWGRFGGINDRFAILGPEAAQAYFTTYEHIPELLAGSEKLGRAPCPFHPESLVRASLERSNITIHDTLRTEFSTLRTNGEQRWPEITPVDMAHAALRAA